MGCHLGCIPGQLNRVYLPFPFSPFALSLFFIFIIPTIVALIMAYSPHQDCNFLTGMHASIDLIRVSRLGNSLTVIDLACDLQTRLSTSTLGQPLFPPDVVQHLDHALAMDPLNTLVRGDMDAKRLDAVGSSLWNACTQMLAVRGKTDEDIQALSKARTAAFVLLNLAVPPTMLGWLRSLGVSLIAAQTCIGKYHTNNTFLVYEAKISNDHIVAKQLNAAYNILGVSGERLQAVQPSHLGLDLTLNYSLTTKYWLLRIRLVSYSFEYHTRQS